MGLIDLIDDSADRRYKLVVLTPIGNELALAIDAIFEGVQ